MTRANGTDILRLGTTRGLEPIGTIADRVVGNLLAPLSADAVACVERQGERAGRAGLSVEANPCGCNDFREAWRRGWKRTAS